MQGKHHKNWRIQIVRLSWLLWPDSFKNMSVIKNWSSYIFMSNTAMHTKKERRQLPITFSRKKLCCVLQPLISHFENKGCSSKSPKFIRVQGWHCFTDIHQQRFTKKLCWRRIFIFFCHFLFSCSWEIHHLTKLSVFRMHVNEAHIYFNFWWCNLNPNRALRAWKLSIYIHGYSRMSSFKAFFIKEQ